MFLNGNGLKGIGTAVLLSILLSAFPIISGTGQARAGSVADTIAALLRNKAFQGGRMTVEIRDTETGKLIFSKGADKRLVPASNMKIITAAAALTKLGPGYRFNTEVWVDGPIKNGVLHGNMYLKGYGDPSLVDEYLWTLARDIAYRGLTEVKGKIIADDSYFDTRMHGEGWGKIGPEAYYAPMSALSLNFNTFVVTANPARQVGSPPRLFYMPPDRHLRLVNRALTVDGKGKCRLKVIKAEDGPNSYEIVGTIPIRSETLEIRRTIGEPPTYAVGSFEAYLISWGVMVSGEIEKGKVPKNAKLYQSMESKPLSRILWDAGKMSNNFVTEQILKTLCAEAGPPDKRTPATTQCGVEVLSEFLSGLGVNSEGYRIADGSGLSRLNKISANTIAMVLAGMKKNEVLWPEFAASLSIAGVDGTLEDRFLKSSLKGKVRAKTGHLTGVNALSGYVPSKSGHLLAFSMIFNNFSGYHSTVERLQEKVLEAAARY